MTSIGSMWTRVALVPVVIGLAVLTLACSQTQEAASPGTTPARTETPGRTPPEELADGSPLPELPSAVASAFHRPIVGAQAVDAEHRLVRTCLANERAGASSDPFQGTYAGGYLSPFGGGVQFEVTASVAQEPPDRALLACGVVWRSGQPRPGAGAVHPWSDDDALRGAGGALSYAESVAFLSVPVPEQAAWLVHDRGDYLVAYPVTDRLPVRVSTPVGQATDTLTISIVYLDEDGERIGTDEVTGAVAG